MYDLAYHSFVLVGGWHDVLVPLFPFIYQPYFTNDCRKARWNYWVGRKAFRLAKRSFGHHLSALESGCRHGYQGITPVGWPKGLSAIAYRH
jgi:hypothetical protein